MLFEIEGIPITVTELTEMKKVFTRDVYKSNIFLEG